MTGPAAPAPGPDDLPASLPARLANRLFERHFAWYRAAYFPYKRWSERHGLAFLARRVRSGMVVFDVGANIGFYTRRLAGLVGPRGRVFAFEPEARNFKRLVAECAGLDQVAPIQAAVVERVGRVGLRLSPHLNVDHQVVAAVPRAGGAPGEVVEVPAVRLDDFAAGLPRLDLVKIDVQGAEPRVLAGMREILRRFPELLVVLEFWPWGLARAGSSGPELLALIAGLGLRWELIHGPTVERCLAAAHRPAFYCDLALTRDPAADGGAGTAEGGSA